MSFDRVVFGLLHESAVDQREDDPAEVERRGDVPPRQYRAGEHPVLSQSEVSQALAQILTGDVPAGGGIGILPMDAFDGEAQALLDEVVGIFRIQADILHHLGEALADVLEQVPRPRPIVSSP